MSNQGNQDFKGITHSGVGLNNVGSYQVSGRPFITGSESLAANGEDEIAFPMVTSKVIVWNHTGEVIRVHFASKSTGNTISNFHYVELDADNQTIELNVKCQKIFISAPNSGSARKYRVIAELTNIDSGRMYELDTTGLDGISA